jgi:hypothetical protein
MVLFAMLLKTPTVLLPLLLTTLTTPIMLPLLLIL